jgi:hypothetical protein
MPPVFSGRLQPQASARGTYRSMPAQRGCDIGKTLYLRQPERGCPAPGARRCVYIGARVNQGPHRFRLVFVDGMHQSSPVIDATALVNILSGPDQLGDSPGISGTRGHAQRGNRDSGIASQAAKREQKQDPSLHRADYIRQTLYSKVLFVRACALTLALPGGMIAHKRFLCTRRAVSRPR